MLSGVQTGNGIPHDTYNIRGITHAHTNRKDDIFMQRQLGRIFTCLLEWGKRTCKKSRQYPARVYTTLVVIAKPYPDMQKRIYFLDPTSEFSIIFAKHLTQNKQFRLRKPMNIRYFF